MDAITLNLLVLMAGGVGAYLFFKWQHQRWIDDQTAAFWSNVREPLCYRSQDIEDEGVVERAANAKKKLALHGNRYIGANDVFFWVYRSDKDDATADFMAWADLRDGEAQQIRKAFREAKARQMADAGNPTGGAQMFGQQKMGQ